MKTYFGKVTNASDVTGWICRAIYSGGYFADFGGDGFSKSEAIDLFKMWENCRSEIKSVQLFEKHTPKPKPEQQGVIKVSGYFTDREYLQSKCPTGGWDLH